MKKLIFSLPFLASLFPFVLACSEHFEETQPVMLGFNFFGGIISTLLIISLILSISLLTKKLKGGKKQ